MGGKKDEDKDLRKEVEMTEHTDSIEKVCQQYQTCGEKGLTDSAVEDVSLEWSIFSSETPTKWSTSRLGPAGLGPGILANVMSLRLYTSLEKIDKNRPKLYSVFKFVWD